MENLNKLRELTNSLEKVENNLKNEKAVLEFILEHTTDGYWDWDVPNGYEYLSLKFKKQLGYEPHELENKPESWQKLCNKEDLNNIYKIIDPILNGVGDEFTEKLRFTHKKGHEITILCRGKVIEREENNKPKRIIGTHTII